jgi:hypothetical protein
VVADGFDVDLDQIRTHARDIDTLRGRFDAVKTASAYITQDDRAYGLLCGWISAILESRHTRQDELIAYVEQNLSLVADGLRQTAETYATADADTADQINEIERELA